MLKMITKVIDFVADPVNALEAHEMGLITLDKISLDALKSKNDDFSKEGSETPPKSKPEASEA